MGRLRRRDVLLAGSGLLANTLLPGCSAPSSNAPYTKYLPDAQDVHLLRRISFGPTLQELDQLKRLGRRDYIEQQLQIRDNGVQLQAAALYPSILLSSQAIYLQTLSGFIAQLPRQHIQQAMLYRATFSKSQLFEVMVEFWNDHFNTDLKKNPIADKIPLDREVIRVHALGNFKTLLKATVRTPEMLYYLDNCQNAAGDINENYARELLELHTMGVDGGYSEADMKALSRILSGLRYVGLNENLSTLLAYGTVYFDDGQHDRSAKTFLGTAFPEGGGEEEIDRALDLILAHPGTARFIARKLCLRFVSDAPPDSIVSAVAARFTSSNGDIAEMLRTLLNSAEFSASVGQRIKRPTTAFISAIRALGMNPFDGIINASIFGVNGILYQGLIPAGQEPFSWSPPNGYPDTVAYWNNTNALLYHQRFTAALTESAAYGRMLTDPLSVLALGGDVGTTPVHQYGLPNDTTPRQIVDNSIVNLLFGTIPDAAYQALLDYVSQGRAPDSGGMSSVELQQKAKTVAYVLLTSPWFFLR